MHLFINSINISKITDSAKVAVLGFALTLVAWSGLGTTPAYAECDTADLDNQAAGPDSGTTISCSGGAEGTDSGLDTNGISDLEIIVNENGEATGSAGGTPRYGIDIQGGDSIQVRVVDAFQFPPGTTGTVGQVLSIRNVVGGGDNAINIVGASNVQILNGSDDLDQLSPGDPVDVGNAQGGGKIEGADGGIRVRDSDTVTIINISLGQDGDQSACNNGAGSGQACRSGVILGDGDAEGGGDGINIEDSTSVVIQNSTDDNIKPSDARSVIDGGPGGTFGHGVHVSDAGGAVTDVRIDNLTDGYVQGGETGMRVANNSEVTVNGGGTIRIDGTGDGTSDALRIDGAVAPSTVTINNTQTIDARAPNTGDGVLDFVEGGAGGDDGVEISGVAGHTFISQGDDTDNRVQIYAGTQAGSSDGIAIGSDSVTVDLDFTNIGDADNRTGDDGIDLDDMGDIDVDNAEIWAGEHGFQGSDADDNIVDVGTIAGSVVVINTQGTTGAGVNLDNGSGDNVFVFGGTDTSDVDIDYGTYGAIIQDDSEFNEVTFAEGTTVTSDADMPAGTGGIAIANDSGENEVSVLNGATVTHTGDGGFGAVIIDDDASLGGTPGRNGTGSDNNILTVAGMNTAMDQEARIDYVGEDGFGILIRNSDQNIVNINDGGVVQADGANSVGMLIDPAQDNTTNVGTMGPGSLISTMSDGYVVDGTDPVADNNVLNIGDDGLVSGGENGVVLQGDDRITSALDAFFGGADDDGIDNDVNNAGIIRSDTAGTGTGHGVLVNNTNSDVNNVGGEIYAQGRFSDGVRFEDTIHTDVGSSCDGTGPCSNPETFGNLGIDESGYQSDATSFIFAGRDGIAYENDVTGDENVNGLGVISEAEKTIAFALSLGTVTLPDVIYEHLDNEGMVVAADDGISVNDYFDVLNSSTGQIVFGGLSDGSLSSGLGGDGINAGANNIILNQGELYSGATATGDSHGVEVTGGNNTITNEGLIITAPGDFDVTKGPLGGFVALTLDKVDLSGAEPLMGPDTVDDAGAGGDGINANVDGEAQGVITNDGLTVGGITGRIVAEDDGIEVGDGLEGDDRQQVLNVRGGNIWARDDGILGGDDVYVLNDATSTIVSLGETDNDGRGSFGINLENGAEIQNDGLIAGDGGGIKVKNAANTLNDNGGVVNTGTIDVGTTAVLLDGDDNNFDNETGALARGMDIGVDIQGDRNDVDNDGTIEGGMTAGVRIEGTFNSVTGDGPITVTDLTPGADGDGLQIIGGSNNVVAIDNDITGDNHGVFLSNTSLNNVNANTITGREGDGVHITGGNTNVVTADVEIIGDPGVVILNSSNNVVSAPQITGANGGVSITNGVGNIVTATNGAGTGITGNAGPGISVVNGTQNNVDSFAAVSGTIGATLQGTQNNVDVFGGNITGTAGDAVTLNGTQNNVQVFNGNASATGGDAVDITGTLNSVNVLNGNAIGTEDGVEINGSTNVVTVSQEVAGLTGTGVAIAGGTNTVTVGGQGILGAVDGVTISGGVPVGGINNQVSTSGAIVGASGAGVVISSNSNTVSAGEEITGGDFFIPVIGTNGVEITGNKNTVSAGTYIDGTGGTGVTVSGNENEITTGSAIIGRAGDGVALSGNENKVVVGGLGVSGSEDGVDIDGNLNIVDVTGDIAGGTDLGDDGVDIDGNENTVTATGTISGDPGVLIAGDDNTVSGGSIDGTVAGVSVTGDGNTVEATDNAGTGITTDAGTAVFVDGDGNTVTSADVIDSDGGDGIVISGGNQNNGNTVTGDSLQATGAGVDIDGSYNVVTLTTGGIDSDGAGGMLAGDAINIVGDWNSVTTAGSVFTATNGIVIGDRSVPGSEVEGNDNSVFIDGDLTATGTGIDIWGNRNGVTITGTMMTTGDAFNIDGDANILDIGDIIAGGTAYVVGNDNNLDVDNVTAGGTGIRATDRNTIFVDGNITSGTAGSGGHGLDLGDDNTVTVTGYIDATGTPAGSGGDGITAGNGNEKIHVLGSNGDVAIAAAGTGLRLGDGNEDVLVEGDIVGGTTGLNAGSSNTKIDINGSVAGGTGGYGVMLGSNNLDVNIEDEVVGGTLGGVVMDGNNNFTSGNIDGSAGGFAGLRTTSDGNNIGGNNINVGTVSVEDSGNGLSRAAVELVGDGNNLTSGAITGTASAGNTGGQNVSGLTIEGNSNSATVTGNVSGAFDGIRIDGDGNTNISVTGDIIGDSDGDGDGDGVGIGGTGNIVTATGTISGDPGVVIVGDTNAVSGASITGTNGGVSIDGRANAVDATDALGTGITGGSGAGVSIVGGADSTDNVVTSAAGISGTVGVSIVADDNTVDAGGDITGTSGAGVAITGSENEVRGVNVAATADGVNINGNGNAVTLTGDIGSAITRVGGDGIEISGDGNSVTAADVYASMVGVNITGSIDNTVTVDSIDSLGTGAILQSQNTLNVTNNVLAGGAGITGGDQNTVDVGGTVTADGGNAIDLGDNNTVDTGNVDSNAGIGVNLGSSNTVNIGDGNAATNSVAGTAGGVIAGDGNDITVVGTVNGGSGVGVSLGNNNVNFTSSSIVGGTDGLVLGDGNTSVNVVDVTAGASVSGANGDGVRMGSSNVVVIEGDGDVTGTQQGLQIDGSSNQFTSGRQVSGTQTGVDVNGDSNIVSVGNILSTSGQGLDIDANQNTVTVATGINSGGATVDDVVNVNGDGNIINLNGTDNSGSGDGIAVNGSDNVFNIEGAEFLGVLDGIDGFDSSNTFNWDGDTLINANDDGIVLASSGQPGALESLTWYGTIIAEDDGITGDQDGDGVAETGDFWSIVNMGEINANEEGDNNDGTGIKLNDDNYVENTLDALITGYDGIMANDRNTIINDGTINVENDGIIANDFNFIQNNSDLTIIAGDDGIVVDDFNLVENNGSIDAGDAGIRVGSNNGFEVVPAQNDEPEFIASNNGGVFNSGIITAGGDGIDAEGSLNLIVNDGDITGGDDGVDINGDDNRLFNNNNAGDRATITGSDEGVEVAGDRNLVQNFGHIDADDGGVNANGADDGVDINGSDNLLINAAGATIESHGAAFQNDLPVDDITQNLTAGPNFGDPVTGGPNGLQDFTTVDDGFGNQVFSALVTEDIYDGRGTGSDGVAIGDEDDGHSNSDDNIVVNSGTISGAEDGVEIYGSSSGNIIFNAEGGQIIGRADDGVELEDNADGNFITNFGTIVGEDNGVFLTDDSDNNLITNASNESITGGSTDCVIQGRDCDGIRIEGGSDNNTIQNGIPAQAAAPTVVIIQDDQGRDVAVAGTTVAQAELAGTITGQDDGIDVEDSSGTTINNTASSRIEGIRDDGIELDDDSVVNNAGTILGGVNYVGQDPDDGANGIEMNDDNAITSIGLIQGAVDGIDGDDNNVITNTGDIIGVVNGVEVDDNNTINNITFDGQSGLIQGGMHGIIADDNNIVNNGPGATIQVSNSTAGVAFIDLDDPFSGANENELFNRGNIGGGEYGVWVTGNGNDLYNIDDSASDSSFGRGRIIADNNDNYANDVGVGIVGDENFLYNEGDIEGETAGVYIGQQSCLSGYDDDCFNAIVNAPGGIITVTGTGVLESPVDDDDDQQNEAVSGGSFVAAIDTSGLASNTGDSQVGGGSFGTVLTYNEGVIDGRNVVGPVTVDLVTQLADGTVVEDDPDTEEVEGGPDGTNDFDIVDEVAVERTVIAPLTNRFAYYGGEGVDVLINGEANGPLAQGQVVDPDDFLTEGDVFDALGDIIGIDADDVQNETTEGSSETDVASGGVIYGKVFTGGGDDIVALGTGSIHDDPNTLAVNDGYLNGGQDLANGVPVAQLVEVPVLDDPETDEDESMGGTATTMALQNVPTDGVDVGVDTLVLYGEGTGDTRGQHGGVITEFEVLGKTGPGTWDLNGSTTIDGFQETMFIGLDNGAGDGTAGDGIVDEEVLMVNRTVGTIIEEGRLNVGGTVIQPLDADGDGVQDMNEAGDYLFESVIASDAVLTSPVVEVWSGGTLGGHGTVVTDPGARGGNGGLYLDGTVTEDMARGELAVGTDDFTVDLIAQDPDTGAPIADNPDTPDVDESAPDMTPDFTTVDLVTQDDMGNITDNVPDGNPDTVEGTTDELIFADIMVTLPVNSAGDPVDITVPEGFVAEVIDMDMPFDLLTDEPKYATLSPGDEDGNKIGTLTVVGNVNFSSMETGTTTYLVNTDVPQDLVTQDADGNTILNKPDGVSDFDIVEDEVVVRTDTVPSPVEGREVVKSWGSRFSADLSDVSSAGTMIGDSDVLIVQASGTNQAIVDAKTDDVGPGELLPVDLIAQDPLTGEPIADNPETPDVDESGPDGVNDFMTFDSVEQDPVTGEVLSAGPDGTPDFDIAGNLLTMDLLEADGPGTGGPDGVYDSQELALQDTDDGVANLAGDLNIVLDGKFVDVTTNGSEPTIPTGDTGCDDAPDGTPNCTADNPAFTTPDGVPDVDADGVMTPTADYTDMGLVYDIIIADTAVNGTFDTYSFDGGDNDGSIVVRYDDPSTPDVDEELRVQVFKAALLYLPDRVRIISIPNFAGKGNTENQNAVGAYIDSFTQYGLNLDSLHEQIAYLGKSDNIAGGLEAFSPEWFNAFNEAAINAAMGNDRQVYLRTLEAQFGASPSNSRVVMNITDNSTSGASGDDNRAAFWLAGQFDTVEVDANNGFLNYEFDTVQGFAGFDYEVINNTLLLGIMGGFGNTDVDFAGRTGEGDIDQWNIGGYLSYFTEDMFAYVQGGIGDLNIESERDINFGGMFGGVDLLALADYDGDFHYISGKAGYSFDIGENGIKLTPEVGLAYVKVETDAFTETGAGNLNLLIDEQSAKSFRVTAQLRVSKTMRTGNGGHWTPYLRAGIAHEFEDDLRAITGRIEGVPGSSFTVNGEPARETTGLFGAGVNAALSDMFSVFLDYEGEFGGGYEEHSVTGGVRLHF
ncbi:MAG: hypothetical protein ACE363_06400 [Alphaproteobacteria bacterium]